MKNLTNKQEFLKNLQDTRKTYLEMVNFCTDSMIINNSIITELAKLDIYPESYSGSDRSYYNANGDEITEEEFNNNEDGDAYEKWDDVFQFFIIPESAAERFAEYTNELIYYVAELDIYLLCVKHCGTAWDYVPSNWKNLEELAD